MNWKDEFRSMYKSVPLAVKELLVGNVIVGNYSITMIHRIALVIEQKFGNYQSKGD